MQPHAGQPIVTAGAPLGKGRGVVIALHGRGASPRNILELAPQLGDDDLTWLAPAAAEGTWYPYTFLAPIEQNEPNLSSALFVVRSLVDDVVAAGVPREKIALLGFSQGACLASEFAVRHAARYGGVIAYSGGLIGPPGTTWNNPGSFAGTPVFFGSSDVDPHVPLSRVQESAAIFERMGAAVTLRVYPGMPHTINQDEIEVGRRMLGEL